MFSISKLFLFCQISVLTAANVSAQSADFSATFGGESQYITEGRDNLSHGGIYTSQLSAGLNNVSVSYWHAEASTEDYREDNAAVGYDFSTGIFTLSPSITYLSFPESDETDIEYGLNIGIELSTRTSVAVDAIYSREASGAYYVFSAGYSLIDTDRWRLASELGLGANDGYVDGEHQGLDHAYLVINSEYSISDSLRFLGSLFSTKPIDKSSTDTLADTQWLRLFIEKTF